eukprot:UN13278
MLNMNEAEDVKRNFLDGMIDGRTLSAHDYFEILWISLLIFIYSTIWGIGTYVHLSMNKLDDEYEPYCYPANG